MYILSFPNFEMAQVIDILLQERRFPGGDLLSIKMFYYKNMDYLHKIGRSRDSLIFVIGIHIHERTFLKAMFYPKVYYRISRWKQFQPMNKRSYMFTAIMPYKMK